MAGVRRWIRLAALAGWFVIALPPHLLNLALTGKSPWPQRFLGVARRLFGVRLKVEGEAVAPGTLLIANHVSWLDILIVGGSTGAAFVSKHEIGGLPLVGWLADQNHTLYIDRSDRRQSHDQVAQIAERLTGDKPLCLFPEGTTSDGTTLLPFRPTLLNAVAPPPPGVVVRPVAIDYGAATRDVAWHSGEPGQANVERVLGRKGRIDATLRLLPPLEGVADRKALARDAHAAIRAALPSLAPADGLRGAAK